MKSFIGLAPDESHPKLESNQGSKDKIIFPRSVSFIMVATTIDFYPKKLDHFNFNYFYCSYEIQKNGPAFRGGS